MGDNTRDLSKRRRMLRTEWVMNGSASNRRESNRREQPLKSAPLLEMWRAWLEEHYECPAPDPALDLEKGQTKLSNGNIFYDGRERTPGQMEMIRAGVQIIDVAMILYGKEIEILLEFLGQYLDSELTDMRGQLHGE